MKSKAIFHTAVIFATVGVVWGFVTVAFVAALCWPAAVVWNYAVAPTFDGVHTIHYGQSFAVLLVLLWVSIWRNKHGSQ